MEILFPRTFGQEPAKDALRQALGQKRFPHALLVHGESGLGQHALLLDLAQILSCESAEKKPCGKCFSCKAFQSASLDAIHYLIPLVKKEKDKDGDKESDDPPALGSALIEELAGLIRQWHAQPYGFNVSEKSEVRVPQARELIGRLGYAQSRSQARVVLVPYLEALNPSAANALLKTLEEPSDGVYFLIASEHRSALLPTLLSRCLHLGLAPLSSETLRQAAVHLGGSAEGVARLLPFAEGSPGALLQLLEQGGADLIEEAGRFFSAATASDWRVFAEYAEQGPAGQGFEPAVRLLEFALRCLRLHHNLRTRHAGPRLGRENGYQWTSQALHAEGWDASLSGTLGPLEDLSDLPGFAAYLESAWHAVKGYCKPSTALLGLFLDYDAKAQRVA